MKINKEKMEEAIKTSNNVSQVKLKLKYSKNNGSCYKTIYNFIKKYNIDISHWGTGKERQNWAKGLSRITNDNINWGYTKDEIFKEDSCVSTTVVRKFLIQEKEIEYKCKFCGLNEWRNEKITLHLDHINGNTRDNRKENLRFLCPNCHSQTQTFCGKNINKFKKKISDEDLIKILESSESIRVALMKAGLTPKGGNYVRVYELIHKHNINHLK